MQSPVSENLASLPESIYKSLIRLLRPVAKVLPQICSEVPARVITIAQASDVRFQSLSEATASTKGSLCAFKIRLGWAHARGNQTLGGTLS